MSDNRAYAPEFAPTVTPLLLAVRRDCSRGAVSATLDQSLLGEADGQRLSDELIRRGLRPEDYLPLPVHPWQWDEVILPGYHPAMTRGELLPIGSLMGHYLPQQSTRTLSNLSDPSRLSLKLAMNLVNTSTSRVLAPHTVQNAPVISDWLPVLHLLWEHGTALESHAQNMILLHEDGLPARVALKDFHDGVRFSKALLSGPAPVLTAPPAEHARVNPNSFLETDDADELRDFTFDALFFVNLAELAWLFQRFYDMAETRFWQITREVLDSHQKRHPRQAERYALFDCFADQVSIELLASRRFRQEIRLRTRLAPNPLVQEGKPPCA